MSETEHARWLRDLLSRRAAAKREIELLQARIGCLDADIAAALGDEVQR